MWTPDPNTIITAEMKTAKALANKRATINTERERRIALGVTVNVTGDGDIPVQGRDEDIRNIQGLGLGALARVSLGDTSTITTFRDANNVDHDLVPQQVLELWQKSAGAVEAILQASWTIKAMDPIPEDITDDALWPQANPSTGA